MRGGKSGAGHGFPQIRFRIASIINSTMATPNNAHDTGYKLLFSHPEMVRDLLTGFFGGAWLEQADRNVSMILRHPGTLI